MHFVFLLTTTVGAAYFFFSARRLDFLSVFFFSGILYTSAAIAGHVGSLHYTSQAYVILVSFFIVVLIGTIAHHAVSPENGPHRHLDDPRVRDHFALMAVGGILLGATSIAVTILDDPRAVFIERSKQIMMENTNQYAYYFYKTFALQAVLTAYLSRRPFILAAASALGLFDLYLGFRFVATMSILGLLVAASQRAASPSPRRWILAGAAAIPCLTLVRALRAPIRSYDWTEVVRGIERSFRTSHGQFFGDGLAWSTLFLAGLEAKLDLGYGHFVSSLRGLVPFFLRSGGEVLTYQHHMRELVDPDVTGTPLAESNLGSWYAAGGLVGVLLFSSCYTALVILLSVRMRKACRSYPLYLAWLPILTFYNFRNDFKQMLVYSELVVSTWFLLAAFAATVLALRGSGRFRAVGSVRRDAGRPARRRFSGPASGPADARGISRGGT